MYCLAGQSNDRVPAAIIVCLFVFLSRLMILACFAIAVRVHLGPIPQFVLLLANCEPYFSSSESEV